MARPRVPIAKKAATVWATEQVFGSQPWLVPPSKKQPKQSVVITKSPPARPVSLDTRYKLAQAAPVKPDARRKLIETMTPARRAALLASMTPQLPTPSRPGLGSNLLHDTLAAAHGLDRGLHALTSPIAAAQLAYQQRHLPGEVAHVAGQAGLGVGRFAGSQLLDLAATLGALKQGGATGIGYGAPAAQAQARVDPRLRAMSTAPLITSVVPNILGAGVGGIYAHRHPLVAIPKDINEAVDIFHGTTQMAGLLVALPQMSQDERRQVASQFVKTMSEGLRNYGNMTLEQSVAEGQKKPLQSILNALAVVDPASELLGGMTAAQLRLVGRGLGRGLSLGESIDHVRMLRLRVGENMIEVPKALPRGVVSRQIARGGDVLSRGADPLFGRTPFLRRLTEGGRAARQFTRLRHQQQARDIANAAAIYRDIAKVTRGRFGRHQTVEEIRLVLEHQKPEGFTHEEWLQAIAEDMRQQLAGREFETPGARESPGLVRARSRSRRFRREADRVTTLQRTRGVHNLALEQERLGKALRDVVDKREAVKAEMQRIDSDQTLSDSERQSKLSAAQQDLRLYDSEAKVAKEKLAQVSVEEPAVTSPARDQAERTLRGLPNLDEQAVQDLLAIGDARARTYARQTGAEPGAWWDKQDVRRASAGDVPVAARFEQRRGVVAPESFKAATDGADILDKYTPVKERGQARAKIAGLPKTIKSRADFGRLLEDMAGRLEAGVGFAKNWYRDSGREILAATGGDKDRADLVAQLTAIYSPQKPVAPNIALALRVLHDWEEGRGVNFGNAGQRNLARKALRGEDWLKSVKPNQLPKVRRFYANLLKHVAPERMAAHGFTGREVTVDGWMGAAFGYGFNTGNSGLTEAQFRLVEDVVQRLADHYGIDPEEAQAAIWTSIKAERDRSTAALYANPATRQQALERAGQSFADAIFTPKNTLRLPIETASPEKAWLNDLTPEQRAAHAAEYGNATLAALHEEGFVARRVGGAIEVSIGDRPVTLMKGAEVVEQTSRKLYLRITQGTRETANGLASAIGDAAKRPRASWKRFLNARGQKGDVTAYRIEIGRPLTQEELATIADNVPGGMHFSATDTGGILALDNPDAVLDRSIGADAATRRDLTAQAKERQQQVDALVESAFPADTEATIDHLAHRGGLIDHGDYQAQISRGRRSDLYRRLRDRLARDFEQIDSRYRGGDVYAQRTYDQGRDVQVVAEQATAGHAAGLGGQERTWLGVRRPGRPVAVRFSRLTSGEDLQLFADAVARNGHPDFLTQHGPDELARNTVFLSEDGNTGVMVTPEGDLQNLFNNEAGVRGAGSDATELAVAHGARTLDSFDRHTEYYRRHGFEVSGRMSWSDEHAPPNWDYEKYGRPDVVFMSQGASRLEAEPFFTDWEQAKAHSSAQVGSGLLAQSRRGDLLGAVQYLDSPAGDRIIYLTQNADVSTVLHEMIGHGAAEMKRYYPDEFARVEEQMGRPYEQWDIVDHEAFARQAERYFLEGYAPTPELVNVFGRLKTWMRTIYAGIKNRLGGRLPVETRNLLDSYLGGYDDPGAARISFYMGPERAFTDAPAARGVAAQARKEFERLEKSAATRAANKSIEGKRSQLSALQAKDTLTPEEVQQIDTLGAEILTHEANDAALQWKRDQNLGKKLGDLERALAKPADSPEHQAAREAMQWYADDRERILRETFGDTYDEVFSNRVDLLADWLVSHNLLEPDFTSGSARYFPFSIKHPKLRQTLRDPSAPLVSRVIGSMKKDRLGLHKRNNMILWQRGDWKADPMVLVEAHQRAQGYAFMNEMKNTLYALGRPLTVAEAQGITPLGDVIFVNPHATPIGPNLRAAMQEIETGSKTHDVQNFLDAAEGGDNEAALSSLDHYQQSIFIDPKTLPEGFDLQALAHHPTKPIHVLPRSVVEMLTPPIRGSSRGPGRVLDFGMTLARWALIYMNVPGYMLVNSVGNLGFLMAQQGPWRLPLMVNDMRRLLMNPKLLDRIGGETGELPLLAQVARGRGAGRLTRAYELEHRALNKISVVDRYPRALAWMYEAKKRGYKTDAAMARLIDGVGPKAERDRMVIGDLARNHMVDFDRLTPFERNSLTRVLFVYPWVRGATAWPFWFAKQYPVRTALGADAAIALENRRKRMLGPAPPWYSGLFPISSDGKTAHVLNAGPFSPTQTAADSIKVLQDTVASALGRKPDNLSAQLVDLVAPQWRTTVQAGTGFNQYGKAVSLQDTLKGTLVSMVPGWRLGQALLNPDSAPRVYTDANRKLNAERTFLRITPSDISIPRLNLQAQTQGAKTVSEKIDDEVAALTKQWHKVAPGQPLDQVHRRGIVIAQTYEAQKQELQRSLSRSRAWDPPKNSDGTYQTQAQLTPLQDAHLLWAVVMATLPGAGVPPPESLMSEGGVTRGSFSTNQMLRNYKEKVWSTFVTPKSTLESNLQKAKASGAIR